jgi:hypothetical protein
MALADSSLPFCRRLPISVNGCLLSQRMPGDSFPGHHVRPSREFLPLFSPLCRKLLSQLPSRLHPVSNEVHVPPLPSPPHVLVCPSPRECPSCLGRLSPDRHSASFPVIPHVAAGCGSRFLKASPWPLCLMTPVPEVSLGRIGSITPSGPPPSAKGAPEAARFRPSTFVPH